MGDFRHGVTNAIGIAFSILKKIPGIAWFIVIGIIAIAGLGHILLREGAGDNSDKQTMASETVISQDVGQVAPNQSDDADQADSSHEEALETNFNIRLMKWTYSVFRDDLTGKPRYMATIGEYVDPENHIAPRSASIAIIDDPIDGEVVRLNDSDGGFRCPDTCPLNWKDDKGGAGTFYVRVDYPAAKQPSLVFLNPLDIESHIFDGDSLRLYGPNRDYNFKFAGFDPDAYHPNDAGQASR